MGGIVVDRGLNRSFPVRFPCIILLYNGCYFDEEYFCTNYTITYEQKVIYSAPCIFFESQYICYMLKTIEGAFDNHLLIVEGSQHQSYLSKKHKKFSDFSSK